MNILMVNTHNSRGGAARMASTLVRAIINDSSDIKARFVHFGDSLKIEPFVGIKNTTKEACFEGVSLPGLNL